MTSLFSSSRITHFWHRQIIYLRYITRSVVLTWIHRYSSRCWPCKSGGQGHCRYNRFDRCPFWCSEAPKARNSLRYLYENQLLVGEFCLFINQTEVWFVLFLMYLLLKPCEKDRMQISFVSTPTIRFEICKSQCPFITLLSTGEAVKQVIYLSIYFMQF